jgi:hypothetical protein
MSLAILALIILGFSIGGFFGFITGHGAGYTKGQKHAKQSYFDGLRKGFFTAQKLYKKD